VSPQIVRRFGAPLYEPFVASFDAEAIIVNIGCGDRTYGRSNILNLDIVPGPVVDLVGAAEALPQRDEVVDGVILQAVLEHVADSERTLAEILRVLRPGGRAMIDLPFIQGYHASPADYRRYTEMGLRNELERHGFEVAASGVAVGPASGMAWVTADFLALLLSGRSKRLFLFTRLLTRPLVWPLQWLDVALQEHPMAHIIASGVWAEARKPSEDSEPHGPQLAQ
jgi:SAM-dependent methyltransferase